MRYFADLTSPAVDELRRDARRTVLLLPVGATEPHGPHAPLSTDSIISAKVCDLAASEFIGDSDVRALVLPALPYGVTGWNAADSSSSSSPPAP